MSKQQQGFKGIPFDYPWFSKYTIHWHCSDQWKIFSFKILPPPPALPSPKKKYPLQRKSVKMWKYWSEQFSDAYFTGRPDVATGYLAVLTLSIVR